MTKKFPSIIEMFIYFLGEGGQNPFGGFGIKISGHFRKFNQGSIFQSKAPNLIIKGGYDCERNKNSPLNDPYIYDSANH